MWGDLVKSNLKVLCHGTHRGPNLREQDKPLADQGDIWLETVEITLEMSEGFLLAIDVRELRLLGIELLSFV